MSGLRLLHQQNNQFGVTKGKHLSFDARTRVGGRCFWLTVRLLAPGVVLAFTLLGIYPPYLFAAPPAISVGSCAEVFNTGASGLVVRSGPGTGYSKVGTIPDGTIVKIVGGPTNNNGYTWWKHDRGGWSAGNWLREKSCPGGGPSAQISARIDNYSAEPRQLKVGETTTLKLNFTNTGNATWTFYAATTLKKPNGGTVDLSLQPVSLGQGQQGTVTWTHSADMEGNWDLVFGVWKESAHQNSLDRTGWLVGYITVNQFETLPRLVLSSPLVISPAKDAYNAGESLQARFTIRNMGNVPTTLDVLTAGGRDPDGTVIDFGWERNVTVGANSEHPYFGQLLLPPKAGTYHFFCSYRMLDGNWNTSIDLGERLTDKDRIKDIVVNVSFISAIPPRNRGMIVIPRDQFPEGDGNPIPIYVPPPIDDSPTLRYESYWETRYEKVVTDNDFDWNTAIIEFKPGPASTPLEALLEAIIEFRIKNRTVWYT
jgi:hypothetical protein